VPDLGCGYGSLSVHVDRPFHFVVGIFILHHFEPFEMFAEELDSVLAPGGRSVYENSSRNPVLRFLRRDVAGRYDAPKLGGDDEIPLQQCEIGVLRERFPQVRALHPSLYLSRLANICLFRTG
jgi:hypothetical protein